MTRTELGRVTTHLVPASGDTRRVAWFEQASAAETAGDWDIAIDLVSARAECYSTDYSAHGNHLWHMDLLVRAQRLDELAERARSDVHARRRLNRALRDQGMEAALHRRASGGDRDAFYQLVRLLCGTSQLDRARGAVEEIDAENQHAWEILARFGVSPNSPR
ncbi:hypothetical protein ACIBL6_14175 [Streptomyces sp. NPDC050400]|uniref:hypothetical protein n=1 Tax=Streptomyces sp. NPDC050400 TaxID=3365610 RepID=UPI00379F00C1